MLQFDLQFYEELTVARVKTVKFISGAFFWPTGQLVCLDLAHPGFHLPNRLLGYRNNKYNTIYMYSGITSGRVLNGELLYTKILEVNLFAFAYRLYRRDFSPLDGTYCTRSMSRRVGRNLYETVCRQMQTN